MLKGLVLLIAIIVFAILSVLCFIFTIIYLANSKKGKFAWLGGFLFSVVALIISVYLLTSGIARKASSFASNIEKTMANSGQNFMNQIDTSQYHAYVVSDSLNKQIAILKSMEHGDFKDKAPKQFYGYLGFGQYYRLPLRYPFSLHCSDSLGNASLFNEIEVTKFDENDNGEKDCQLSEITEFIFDEHLLIAKQKIYKGDYWRNNFVIYHFDTSKLEDIGAMDKLLLRLKNLNFSKPLTFINCKDYYNSFSR